MKKICLLFTVMAMFFTALSASAQNVVVTGTIVDSSNGETIAGASVMVKDTRILPLMLTENTVFPFLQVPRTMQWLCSVLWVTRPRKLPSMVKQCSTANSSRTQLSSRMLSL